MGVAVPPGSPQPSIWIGVSAQLPPVGWPSFLSSCTHLHVFLVAEDDIRKCLLFQATDPSGIIWKGGWPDSESFCQLWQGWKSSSPQTWEKECLRLDTRPGEHRGAVCEEMLSGGRDGSEKSSQCVETCRQWRANKPFGTVGLSVDKDPEVF